MEYIPDAYDKWSRHDAEQERRIAQLPECEDCGEHIQDEEAYYINGGWICESCMDCYRREVLPDGYSL